MNTGLVVNPEIGTIDRIMKSGHRRKDIGYIDPQGYKRIRDSYVTMYNHRIVWEAANGPIPKGMVIDHINGNRSDNRIVNLRMVTHAENMQNVFKARAGNASGIKGVTWAKANKKWQARIKINGKLIFLGLFDVKEDAAMAYAKAAAIFHTYNPSAMKPCQS